MICLVTQACETPGAFAESLSTLLGILTRHADLTGLLYFQKKAAKRRGRLLD